MLRYKRSLAVKFGGASIAPLNEDGRHHVSNIADQGIRISFTFERDNRGKPDRGILTMYNTPRDFAIALKSDHEVLQSLREGIQKNFVTFPTDTDRATALRGVTDRFLVTVFAGYRNTLVPIFRGDIVNVIDGDRGSEDHTLTVELGDSLYAMREGYIDQAFGGGAYIENVVRAAAGASGLEVDAASSAVISAVAPNAVITKTQGGYYAVGRPPDVIDEITDLFGLQWWVRDGTIFLVPQGSVTQDFSIVLTNGGDLYSIEEQTADGIRRGQAMFAPELVPGRGLVLLDESGMPYSLVGYRVAYIRGNLDTHEDAWTTEFEATEISASVLPPIL